MSKKVLSICIPTYNRKKSLIADLREYLSLKDDRFQIIVCDNCSTDDTQASIEEIKDSRLMYVRRRVNIGGPANLRDIMNFSDADYNMILLDKDYIKIEYLVEFISFLEQKRPSYGLIELNYTGKIDYMTFESGKESLDQIGYKCFHPSGVYINNKIWKEESQKEWVSAIPKDFDFFFDSFFSIISETYKYTLVKIPLIKMSFMRGLPSGKSFTYNLDNLYFMPNKVHKSMEIFLNGHKEGSMSIKHFNDGVRLILRNTLKRVSYEFRERMRTPRHVEHYGIENRNVGLYEMFSNILITRQVFRKKTKELNIGLKRRLETYELLRSMIVSSIVVIKSNLIGK